MRPVPSRPRWPGRPRGGVLGAARRPTRNPRSPAQGAFRGLGLAGPARRGSRRDSRSSALGVQNPPASALAGQRPAGLRPVFAPAGWWRRI